MVVGMVVVVVVVVMFIAQPNKDGGSKTNDKYYLYAYESCQWEGDWTKRGREGRGAVCVGWGWGCGGAGHLDGYVDVVVAVTHAHSEGAGGVRQR